MILFSFIWILSFISCQSIICPDTGDCICPATGDCIISCEGWYLCRDRQIIAPTNGSLHLNCSDLYSCANAQVYAPTNGDLTVRCHRGTSNNPCRGTFSIHGDSMVSGTLTFISETSTGAGRGAPTIYCPGNNLQCNVHCLDPHRACADVIVHTSDSTKLNLIASGDSALLASTIYCPPFASGSCSLTIYGGYSAMLDQIKIYAANGMADVSLTCNYATDVNTNCYSTSSNPSLYCKSNYGTGCAIDLIAGYDDWECTDSTGHNNADMCQDTFPDGWHANEFDCTGGTQCAGRLNVCNDNVHCVVRCDSTIWGTCPNSQIIAPQNGNLTVVCDSYHACDSATIMAPHYGSLDVQCTNDNGHKDSCLKVKVDARQMIEGSLHYKSTIDYNQRYIYCPGNGNECNVDCEGSKSCHNTYFYTQPDSKLHITASGPNAMHISHVYCPNNGECTIYASGSDSDMMGGMNIYALNGLYDVSLVCDYSMDTSNCYDNTTYPTLRCNNNNAASCPIELVSGTNNWECVNGDFINVCAAQSYNPTATPSDVPTSYPTLEPTYPTTTPSDVPTSYPTLEPTYAPTSYPTLEPSYNPTTTPSDGPTLYPTVEPTYNPTTTPSDVPTSYPTLEPTYDPTTTPSDAPTSATEYPTLPSRVPTITSQSPTRPLLASNYTIFIGLNCDDDDGSECSVDTEALKQHISVAIDGDVDIFRIEIINDEVVISLSITTASGQVLQTEDIKRDMEREIEGNPHLSDVEVEEKDPVSEDSGDDAEKGSDLEEKQSESMIAVEIAAVTCAILVFVVLCLIFLNKRQKRNIVTELVEYQASATTGTADTGKEALPSTVVTEDAQQNTITALAHDEAKEAEDENERAAAAQRKNCENVNESATDSEIENDSKQRRDSELMYVNNAGGDTGTTGGDTTDHGSKNEAYAPAQASYEEIYPSAAKDADVNNEGGGVDAVEGIANAGIHDAHSEMKQWFNTGVNLKAYNERYFKIFIEYGYEDMSLVKEITENELNKMGITKMAHQNRILSAIRNI